MVSALLDSAEAVPEILAIGEIVDISG